MYVFTRTIIWVCVWMLYVFVHLDEAVDAADREDFEPAPPLHVRTGQLPLLLGGKWFFLKKENDILFIYKHCLIHTYILIIELSSLILARILLRINEHSYIHTYIHTNRSIYIHCKSVQYIRTYIHTYIFSYICAYQLVLRKRVRYSTRYQRGQRTGSDCCRRSLSICIDL